MGVTRCICTDQSFEDLLRTARERRMGFDELREATGCCTGCGMCEPYVRIALRTGRTDLPVIEPGAAPRDDDPLP